MKSIEIAFILDFNIGFREEVAIELGAVVIGHGCHVVYYDLVGLGFHIGSVGRVVVVGYKVHMVCKDGR